MTNPWISVVIPTYNRMESLRVTLDGLGRQGHPNAEFEVIVVSDGSSDGTNEYLKRYAREAAYRLRPFMLENGGPGRARNHGIREAAGELIVLIDDDVEPIPEFLAAHAVRHRPPGQKPVDRLVVIGPMLSDPKRRSCEPAWIAWEHAMLRKQYGNWESGRWPSAGAHHFYSGNASFRRKHALAVGGFDETFKRLEDVEMATRMERQCGMTFAYDPAPVGIHRPIRSFESWLGVAEAYGRLEVVRARAGDERWSTIRDRYRCRNIVTRLTSSLVLAMPSCGALIHRLLAGTAKGAYAIGIRSVALGFLSVLFNVRYLESASAEMGSGEFKRLLKDPSLQIPPAKSPDREE